MAATATTPRARGAAVTAPVRRTGPALRRGWHWPREHTRFSTDQPRASTGSAPGSPTGTIRASTGRAGNSTMGYMTIAIVGAGPGLGAAVARKFGREGFAVVLIAHNPTKLEALEKRLAADGVTARGYVAGVRDRAALTRALGSAAEDLGPIEVMQFSPVPGADFLKPVLETTVEDLRAAVELSILGILRRGSAGAARHAGARRGHDPPHQRVERRHAQWQGRRHVHCLRRGTGVRGDAPRGGGPEGGQRATAHHPRRDRRRRSVLRARGARRTHLATPHDTTPGPFRVTVGEEPV